MGFNIFNVFKKKQKYGELEMKMREIANSIAESGSLLGESLKSGAFAIKTTTSNNFEIQRLQEIQKRTKKQRTKKKLQKRIDAYEK
ncbi:MULTISPECIES: hypothetical protein [Paenibacillus]|uniref:hypothetical protein n=1 Tax=Paenibacillus TaxID=44249 RepID=UPI00096D8495|nr:hypothetical protein [Paenibacillus odorifer]OMD66889.1 hypothetical protein BSK50_30395 [Paenibacillus odorifer]